jgi:peptidyl-prolyl cis-trans isomerase A (cyclophilin A)
LANRHALFQTTKGDFKVELFETRAPKTTANFVSLIEKGFYDDVVFHRVIPDFMIQGGCPEGTGRGGPGYNIQDEFHAELRHSGEGLLSMANAGPNTGGSQFFVTLVATPWLDNKHAVFGRVVEGMDVVQAIGKTQTDRNDRPVEPVVMKKVSLEAAA